ncbi:ABC transporter, ATP-binding protein 1 (cluster 4, leucine/isoleucine/valine/benzoate) [Olavius sp. associated proteobacterium Delta 1]|nr:ABC transporter, ATP-binding protein 1 (cluster 4, leucine/isoleucine/valine/benzoate) [Olavius sp. associated proteobacterium Delta 1]
MDNSIADNTIALAAGNIRLSFGRIQVLDDVSFDIKQDEILSIIGPNGAGKTSLMNCLSGFYKPQEGQIEFRGRDITGMPMHRRAHLGMGRTFQGIQLFPHMSVLENILAGRHVRMKTNFLQSFVHWPWVRREEVAHRRVVEEIIDFLEMEFIRDSIVGELGYGLRKRVDLGRALALEPEILIMDEPMAGMNVEEKEDMARFIIDIQEYRKIPVILVEHDMEVVMDISNRIAVLEWGHMIAEGPPDEIRDNPRVINAYLGEEQ